MQPRIQAIISLIVLFAFWGMLAYDFRGELMPFIQRVETSLRPIETKTYTHTHFQIQDNANTDESMIEGLITELEAEYEQISTHWAIELSNPIEVQIHPGITPASMGRRHMILFTDGETVYTELAPTVLQIIIQRNNQVSSNLFLTMGHSIYQAEEASIPTGLGDASDLWTLRLSRNGRLVPFDEAWNMAFPSSSSNDDAYLRAAIQSGSFVRWLIDTYGIDALERLLDGERLERVTDLYFPDAQREWLSALEIKTLEPPECQGITQTSLVTRAVCP